MQSPASTMINVFLIVVALCALLMLMTQDFGIPDMTDNGRIFTDGPTTTVSP